MSRKKSKNSKFGYVNHPRYGASPRFTGINPDFSSPNISLRLYGVKFKSIKEFKSYLDYSSGIQVERVPQYIPDTAIVANLDRQSSHSKLKSGPYYHPITYYLDEERECISCKRIFIFYAEEQRYWYEELQFPLEADCLKCHPCRKIHQEIESQKRKYEKLVALKNPSIDDKYQISMCLLFLVKNNIFRSSKLSTVRAFIKRNPNHIMTTDLQKRLDSIINF